MRPPETRGNWYSAASDGMDAEIALSRIRRLPHAVSGRHGTEIPQRAGTLSLADRREVTRQATERGYSSRQIAALLGCSVRTVTRYREAVQRGKGSSRLSL